MLPALVLNDKGHFSVAKKSTVPVLATQTLSLSYSTSTYFPK